MKKRCFLIIGVIAAFIIASCASSKDKTGETVGEKGTEEVFEPETVVDQIGPLRVEGTKIVGQYNQPVQLRGMSLFWSQWMPQYYNEQCVKWLRDDWHCTVVRPAMAVEHGGYLENPEQEQEKVEAVVDAAIKYGLYVIIDYHAHKAHEHTAEAKKFFADMAQKYGEYPNVIYETFNEPLNDVEWSETIKPYHEAVIDTIRHYDSDNIIVCGSKRWSQAVDEASLDPIEGENIAYSLHFYAVSHRQSLRDIAKKAMDNGIALMVTEFGSCHASGDGYVDEEETKEWWAFLDEHKISWCNWSIADKEEAASALTPGASGQGGWTDDQLTKSGKLLKEEIKTKNAQYFE